MTKSEVIKEIIEILELKEGTDDIAIKAVEEKARKGTLTFLEKKRDYLKKLRKLDCPIEVTRKLSSNRDLRIKRRNR